MQISEDCANKHNYTTENTQILEDILKTEVKQQQQQFTSNHSFIIIIYLILILIFQKTKCIKFTNNLILFAL